MKVSFKQFKTFVELPDEQVDEEKLEEIFGVFQNNQKKDELNAKRDDLKNQADAKKKALRDQKDKMFAKAKQGIEAGKANVTQGRGADKDNEFKYAMGESHDPGVISVLEKIASGKLEIYHVQNHPSTEDEKKASKYLQQKYDDIASEFHLHADDDFEEIEEKMMDYIDKEYGDE